MLAVLGLLTFALIPLRINTIYSGLPAHPLLLHVPVILIPVATVMALVLAIRPRWFAAHGVWVGLVTVIALAATNLTMGAGEALRADLHLGGGGFGRADLIARHSHAASILRILLIAFTAVMIVSVAVLRTSDRRITGIGAFDSPLAAIRSTAPLAAALRVLLVVLAARLRLLRLSHRGPRRQGRLAGAARRGRRAAGILTGWRRAFRPVHAPLGRLIRARARRRPGFRTGPAGRLPSLAPRG